MPQNFTQKNILKIATNISQKERSTNDLDSFYYLNPNSSAYPAICLKKETHAALIPHDL